MKIASQNYSFSVLNILGLLMLLTGILIPWVSSPLGASHKLFEIAFAGLEPGTFGTVFAAAIFTYLLVSTLKLPRIALAVSLALLVMIISFYNHIGLSDHPWLVSFLTESDQRTNLEALFNEEYWLNINAEPTITLVPDFEHLFDRVALCWSITAFGCSVTCFGIIFLLIHSGLWLPKETALCIFFGVLILVATIIRSPLVAAELEHRLADSFLSQGQYVRAIESYRAAIDLDPALQRSRAFAVKASYAFLKHEGPESLVARLGLASTRPPTQEQASDTFESAYATYQSLSEADSYIHVSNLQHAILSHTKMEATRLLVRLGLTINNYDHSNSMAVLQQALKRESNQPDTLVLLAHTEIRLGLWDDAIPHLVQALGSIENGGMRANLFCTIGDALQGKGELVRARKAYTDCAEIDDSKNFRAIRNLSGS